MNLHFLSFNNYYNRVVKGETTIADYITYQVGLIENCVLFNTNDGINTSQTYTKSDLSAIPDYLLCTDDSDSEIVSRWFVIEATQTRRGQYVFTLRRDIAVDYLSEILSADIFCEKGPLTIGDPMLYNSESSSFNQIKQKQQSLIDYTGVPWIVGYIVKGESIAKHSVSEGGITAADYTVSSLSSWEYYSWITDGYSHITDYNYVCRTVYDAVILGQNIVPEYTQSWYGTTDQVYKSISPTLKEKIDPNVFQASLIAAHPDLFNNLKKEADIYFSRVTNEIIEMQGNTIFDQSTGYTYSINVLTESSDEKLVSVSSGNLYNLMYTYITSLNGYEISGASSSSGEWFKVRQTVNTYKLQLTQLSNNMAVYEYEIPANRTSTSLVPYDIFAIPYGNVQYKTGVGTAINTTSLNVVQDILGDLALQSESIVLDIQLLPYCPVNLSYSSVSGELNISGDESIQTNKVRYSLITSSKNGTPTSESSFIVYASSDSFYAGFPEFEAIEPEADPIERKVKSDTEFIRICSPNYNGIFEFNVQKNDGLYWLQAACTYKPYNPYIQIYPHFSSTGLYGKEFKDARGLICGGNFSLTRAQDAWINYELQNKNYQNMFNREIESLDFNNAIQQRHDIFNAVIGSINGALGGGYQGSFFGGANGAVAGAAIRGGAAIAGGVMDVVENAQLRAEARDLRFDMFGYQLGNIKALPYSVTRLDAFNIRNNIFPFIEYYSATNAEKNALRSKIKYNGMTVERIGKISEFVGNVISSDNCYVKGKLIRIDISDDTHTVEAIASELYQGFYWEDKKIWVINQQ